MTIKKKFRIYFLVFFSIILFSGVYLFWSGKKIDVYLEEKMPNAISEIEKKFRLNIISQLIRYDDEARTNSITRYVFTGDRKWENRYAEFISKLSLRMNEAINNSDNEEERRILIEIDEINLGIVAIEEQAMNLVNKGDLNSAQQILMDKKYENQKELYGKRIEKLISLENIDLDSTDSIAVDDFRENESNLRNIIHQYIYLILGLMILYLIILGLILLLITKIFLIPMNKFRDVAKEIATGNLDARADIKSNDEMGDLHRDLSQMVDRLKDSIMNVEKKVQQRTEKLNQLNSFMIGRELKMIELKKKIKILENNKK